MSDFTIWAYGEPNEDLVSDIYNSLQNGVSRFCWSWYDNCDLNILKTKEWSQMNKNEQATWSHANFMLSIKPGDYIIHINVPSWGLVTVAKAKSEYYYDSIISNNIGDGRLCVAVEDVVTFDRNDPRVHPMISARLKLRGGHWKIYCPSEFLQTLQTFKNFPNREGFDKNYYFYTELNSCFDCMTKKIQRHYPNKSLEVFLGKFFEGLPNVVDVIYNGNTSYFRSDNGADLIIKLRNRILDYEIINTVVVQVKSYTGQHFDTNAIKQIESAIQIYNASLGIIITTAEKTDILEKELEKLSERISTPVYLISGNKISKLITLFNPAILMNV